jgi:hypothetical protein
MNEHLQKVANDLAKRIEEECEDWLSCGEYYQFKREHAAQLILQQLQGHIMRHPDIYIVPRVRCSKCSISLFVLKDEGSAQILHHDSLIAHPFKCENANKQYRLDLANWDVQEREPLGGFVVGKLPDSSVSCLKCGHSITDSFERDRLNLDKHVCGTGEKAPSSLTVEELLEQLTVDKK